MSATRFLASLRLIILLWCSALAAPAQEVQLHGVVFEEWIRQEFFDGYEPASYTQKWDIPGAANRRFRGLPVNPKATKYGSAIGLGDALRQYDIAEPFILLLGFWQQDGAVKRFVNITPVTIHPETWRMLWGPVTRADLERFDALVKDRGLDYREARRQAQALKREYPFTESLITLNPKVGSSGQRRLQCSLRFSYVFDLLASHADRAAVDHPMLWGVAFPGPVASAARSFADEP
ncbi:hypothetical protein [Synoicihabitans lomoniglobus]|uniref:Uncharacterized protein n=1 Tax=Synoicihabitans lomoniglobus TaxID=2909285 RepID=A0AAF0CMU6_9BACT|nr:hypothetical protein [Opitutaceae bacterium LMO-M01]WED64653.1 hypothetical protein PXH66_20105 [Opitutaceae bacterium LMO-M01]